MTDKKRGRPQKNQKGLCKEVIIETAKKMMLSNNKIPSIRGIATQLNVDAMALYYYFKNKNILLEEITTSLVSDVYEPKGSLDWELEIIELSKSYLTILYRYDGLLQTLLSMNSSSPADIFINRLKFIINPLKLDENQEKIFLDLLVDYLHGYSLALACDQTDTLTINSINKPLMLLFQGIKVEHKQL